MKTCPYCGASVDDMTMVCPVCQANLSQDATQYQTNTPNASMYQAASQDVSQYQQIPQTYPQDAYLYQQLPQQYANAQVPAAPAVKSKKTGKIVLFVVLGFVLAAAIAFCVWFFVFRKKDGPSNATKKQIKAQTVSYIEALNDLDFDKIIELTIPKELLQLAIQDLEGSNNDLGDFDIEYDNLLDEAHDYIDEFIDEYDVSINISNYEITSLTKLDIDEVIDSLYSAAPDLEDSGYSAREMKALIKQYASEYGIDIDNLYNVYIDMDGKISGDGEQFDFDSALLSVIYSFPSVSMYLPFEATDKKGGVALFVAYKYNDEYYLMPNIAVLAPQYIKYYQKANLATDLTNATTINTAVCVLLADADYYDFFTGEGANVLFAVTDEGINQLPAECGQEFREMMGYNLPKPSLKQQGQTHYTFKVTSDGQVYIYVAGPSSEDQWEILPEQDSPYTY